MFCVCGIGIAGQNFDDVECLTAFTPDGQIVPGMELWQFGDAFIRAFMAVFTAQPMRMMKLGNAEQRAFEMHGCMVMAGGGPVVKDDPPPPPPPPKGNDKENGEFMSVAGNSSVQRFCHRALLPLALLGFASHCRRSH